MVKAVANKVTKKTTSKPAKAKSAPKPKAVAKPAAPSANGKANPPVSGAVPFLNLPAPVPVDVDIEELVFDRRLQHREDMTHGPTVKAYREVLQAGEKFPRLKVVREAGSLTDPARYWVYDGFQRGKAYEEEGAFAVPCEVIDGTFADAFFLSLRSNSENSLLPRTADDKKRSILALIDSPEAFKIVQGKVKVKGSGGMQRVIAKAVGASAGYVDEVLEGRGLSVKGDKLVPRREKAKPKTQTQPATPSQQTLDAGNVSRVQADPGMDRPADVTAQPTPEQQRAATQAAYAQFREEPIANRVADAYKAVKRLGLLVSSLIQDKDHGDEFRELLSRYDIPVAEEFDVKARAEGNAFQPYYEILEHWEPVQKVGAVLNLMKGRLAEGEAEKSNT